MAFDIPIEWVEKFSRRDIAVTYPIEPEAQVHVAAMLATDSDRRIRLGHTAIHAPALAIRALALHVGSTLPIYDRSPYNRFEQVDETRVITPHDLFEIKEGPIAASQRGSFLTAVQRVGTPSQPRVILSSTEYNPVSGNFSIRPLDPSLVR